MILIVSSEGILVKRDSTSRLALKHPEFCSHTSIENSELFSTVRMLLLMDSLRGIKLIANKIVYIVDICQAPGCEF